MTAAVHDVGNRQGLKVTSGRMLAELRPNLDWDKGKTLEWIVDQMAGEEPLLPIFLGDDLTDEDGVRRRPARRYRHCGAPQRGRGPRHRGAVLPATIPTTFASSSSDWSHSAISIAR